MRYGIDLTKEMCETKGNDAGTIVTCFSYRRIALLKSRSRGITVAKFAL
jgi:hypothetical protein